MKYCLFLPFLFAVLHLSKAGPLRLQKRAAFYIANETACVVDNIVYINGDPIPTDDPCESCKCRPPGFACVLKDCKPKPGCKAVRHVGQCCPEYICGCEHNGRMYLDGEQIRDEKNPCYECYCQGSSIACAFADCFYRVDCVPVYVPGECCPHYQNCSRAVPERTTFPGDNALPPSNLLVGLYDELAHPGNLPLANLPESTEKPLDATLLTTSGEKIEETLGAEVIEYSKESIIPQSSNSEVPVVEENKQYDPETDKISSDIDEITSEEEKHIHKEESTDETESVEEKKVLLNSESELKLEDSIDVTTVKEAVEGEKSTVYISDFSTEAVPEIRDENPEKIVPSEIEIVDPEPEEITEKDTELSPTSTKILETGKPVKNSAADNSKSLKLNEDTTLDEEANRKDVANEDVEIQDSEKEVGTSASIIEDLPNKIEFDHSKSIDSTENKPESEENVAEESIADPHSVAFYANDDKIIKKESAETVTIVVHVREKSQPPTITDFVTEKIVPESSTSDPTKDVLLKSNDSLENSEVAKESTKDGQPLPTEENFEVFPISTEIASIDYTTNTPEQPEEKIEERSETDPIDSDTVKTTSKVESIVKPEEELSTTVPAAGVGEDDTEISKEARSNEKIAEETKIEDIKVEEIETGDSRVEKIVEEKNVTENPEDARLTEKPSDEIVTEEQVKQKITEIKVEHPKLALKIEITDSEAEKPKVEEVTVEPEKEVSEEKIKVNEEVKDVISDDKPESKSEEILDEEISEEKVEIPKPEEKVEESKEVKEEKLKSGDGVEESQSGVKVGESEPNDKVFEVKLEDVIEEGNLKEKGNIIKPETNGEISESDDIVKIDPEERSEDTEEKLKENTFVSTESEGKKEDKQPEEAKLLNDQETKESDEPKKLK